MPGRGTVVTLVVAAGLMFVWGLSWAWSDFPQCAGAEDFLAGFGWMVGGMLLALAVGAVATGYLSASLGCGAGLLLGIAVVVGIGLFSGLGGAVAERVSDCPGATRSSGELFAMAGFAGAAIGLVLGALVHWARGRASAA